MDQESQENLEVVLEALERLPEDIQRFLRMEFVEGLSPEEIQSKLRLQEPDGVKLLRFEALKALQLALIEKLETAGAPKQASGGHVSNVPAPQGPIILLELPDPSLLSAVRKNPYLLKTLGSREFEVTLAKLLEEQGCEVKLQRGTKDGGVDLFFVRHDSIMGPHRYLLQAKRWNNAVGVEVVRQVLYLHQEHKVTKSCLATTSRFTRGAWKLGASHLWELELKDFDGLLSWLRLARVGGPGKLNS